MPSTSNVNFGVQATTPNAVITAMGTDGSVAFRNATGNVHVISDLFGFFIDPDDLPTAA